MKRCFPTGVALASVFFWCSRRQPLLKGFPQFYLTLLLIGKNIHKKTTSKPLSCYSIIVGSVYTCITGVFLCFYGSD